MMKTLLLMRHAKSSWSDAALADHQRPLNRRGREAAKRIGRLMREQGLAPEQILCSTAVRARQTCDLVTQHWETPISATFLDDLYLCPAAGIPDVLQQATQDVERLLLIGHNPGFADFLAATVNWTEKFPTAALAWLTVEIPSWSKFDRNSSLNLQKLWRPREL